MFIHSVKWNIYFVIIWKDFNKQYYRQRDTTHAASVAFVITNNSEPLSDIKYNNDNIASQRIEKGRIMDSDEHLSRSN